MSPELAKARHKRLTMVRFFGVLLALIGAAIMAGKVALPPIVGLLILLMGVFDVVLFPLMLTRRWKKMDK
ncbi:hypothetical protein GTZ99_09435 [Novosphingobium sp. FSY-8]|uniref:DUF2892 family protein n=1 Tax=Novosphingobium ovatum TaxID=1908523 RepID=A0ABW9XE11_9SPHN|nr:hypothetical protein [Novosphingobium ovatum]NBC36777.1 hypothetical protein [Novosphingobium ovatum]